jgi:hypothetical protein
MSDRVSETILLCEDDLQEQLVRYYMQKCKLNTDKPFLRPLNASRQVQGGNVTWVLREFPEQLRACRKRHAATAKTLLIVVVDADDFEVADRQGHLKADPQVSPTDPLVVLIPRRHIETWIRAALNQPVTEEDDCKKPRPKKSEVRAAAATIYGWAHNTPQPGPTCVPSLHSAFPDWRHIG